MKSQQIALYASLNQFMVDIGYQNAGDLREDDPIWSTLNQNNYQAMMEYKFGVESRFASVVPTKLEELHPAIAAHEAWAYREELEVEDGEEAPVPAPAVAPAATAEANNNGEANPPVPGGTNGDESNSAPDTGEGTGEPASTEQQPEGGQQSEQNPPAADTPPADQPPADEAPKEPEAPQEPKDEQQSEDAAEEGGDSEQE